VSKAEEFERLRPLLFSIAYRILGSVSEAEDAVQETWLRYESSPTQPTSAKAFLAAVITRISIDVLRSARVRREEYVGQWFPEPLLTDPYQDPERSAELADSVSMAALLLLERLTPLERAVFVLREVFGFGFPEVASAVGRSEAACRQLAVRARRHMDAGRPRLVRVEVTLEPRELNGQPGAIFRDRDGKVLNTMVLDVLDGQIQTIRAVQNPEKLRHLGPVADAWAVAREVNQARRPGD
jgi:RNA polymerase sigma-70 factor, ECF subfamily